MNKKMVALSAALAFLKMSTATAALTLMDSNDWKVTINGFIDSDFSHDSTRSLGEIIGNSPVDRSNTFKGDNGRTQFSGRNSRLGFTVYAPEQDGWKSKGVLELDFFGYDPVPSTSAPTNTEAGFFQNATPRMRHAYLSVENDGWQFVAGQTWTLFGWQPYYFPTTLTVAPAPGELFQRNMQAMVMKSVSVGDSSKLQLALSAERPSQRDSGLPNMNVGLRYSLESYRSGYSSTYGDVKAEPLSIGLSGSFRQFEAPISAADTSAQSHKNSSAFAVDGLIPLIPVSDSKDPGNSLTLNFEFTSGTGYADALPNWTGGLSGFPQGAGVSANTNLDVGYGGFDAGGNFDLVKLQTYNVSLQYMLPTSWSSFATIGYAEIFSENVGDFTASAVSAANIYDHSSMYFVNFIHDFTKQIRAGVEYDKVQTHYFSDGATPYNHRVQLTALYRF